MASSWAKINCRGSVEGVVLASLSLEEIDGVEEDSLLSPNKESSGVLLFSNAVKRL